MLLLLLSLLLLLLLLFTMLLLHRSQLLHNDSSCAFITRDSRSARFVRAAPICFLRHPHRRRHHQQLLLLIAAGVWRDCLLLHVAAGADSPRASQA
jgi:hypothetical protein